MIQDGSEVSMWSSFLKKACCLDTCKSFEGLKTVWVSFELFLLSCASDQIDCWDELHIKWCGIAVGIDIELDHRRPFCCLEFLRQQLQWSLLWITAVIMHDESLAMSTPRGIEDHENWLFCHHKLLQGPTVDRRHALCRFDFDSCNNCVCLQSLSFGLLEEILGITLVGSSSLRVRLVLRTR